MKNILIQILLVFCFFVAKGQETDKPETIDVKTRKAELAFPGDLIKGISILPIEFRLDAMIKEISKVQFDGSKYYLLNSIDGFSQNLVIITREGRIDRVLNRKGKGPGEYQQISDFNVDPVKKDLWISDGGKQIYNIYSRDLTFIKSFPADKEFTLGIFLFTPWNSQSILIKNYAIDKPSGKFHGTLSLVTNERVEKTLMDLGEVISTSGGYYRLQGLSDAIDFLPPFSSDIIRIKEGSIKPVYRINFDAPTIKPGTRITDSMHPEIFNQTFYESEFYVLIACMLNNNVYLTFYNKKTHQFTTVQNPWNTKTDEGYLYHILGFVENKLVLSAINLDVKEVVNKLNPDGTKLDDKTILDKIDVESQLSNPILVFIELK